MYIYITRWWFQMFFMFIPSLGNIPVLTDILQMSWNHQPDICVYIYIYPCITLLPLLQVSKLASPCSARWCRSPSSSECSRATLWICKSTSDDEQLWWHDASTNSLWIFRLEWWARWVYLFIVFERYFFLIVLGAWNRKNKCAPT